MTENQIFLLLNLVKSELYKSNASGDFRYSEKLTKTIESLENLEPVDVDQ